MDYLSRKTAQPAQPPKTTPAAATAPRPRRVVISEGSSGSRRQNIGMPSIVPELSEMLKADGTIAVRRSGQPADDIAPPPRPSPSTSDANLARVLDTWPKLPSGIRAAILAMIEATQAAEATQPSAASKA